MSGDSRIKSDGSLVTNSPYYVSDHGYAPQPLWSADLDINRAYVIRAYPLTRSRIVRLCHVGFAIIPALRAREIGFILAHWRGVLTTLIAY